MSLQQGTWALPSGEGFDEGLAQVVQTIDAAGGQPVTLTVADDDHSVAQLERLFTEQRNSEWLEFLGDCDKFEAELADEVQKDKLTLAELDEEEENLERLRRWYRAIRARDLFGAPSASVAERRLKDCTEALERYAELVYQAREPS
jgi:vacuolar-type H+-ATPase subunit I/STV1